MATKKSTSNSTSNKSTFKTNAPLLSIEELAKKNNVPDWILAGVKQRNKWGQGKQVTEKEFLAKIKEFKTGPMRKR